MVPKQPTPPDAHHQSHSAADPGSIQPSAPSGSDPTGQPTPALAGFSPQISRHKPLKQTIALLDLDILQELERFREWQQSQLEQENGVPRLPEPSHPSLLFSIGKPRTSHRSTHAKPALDSFESHDIVEDLESDGGRPLRLISPLTLVVLWCLSCAGFAAGMVWLVSPGDPNRPRFALNAPDDQTEVAPEVLEPALPDLSKLPLIPVRPEDVNVAITDNPLQPPPEVPSALQPAFDPDSFRVERLELASNILDLTQRPRSGLDRDTRSLSARLPAPARTPRPRSTPLLPTPRPQSTTPAQRPSQGLDPIVAATTPSTQRETSLDSTLGEGTFIVLMNYQGDQSLAQARQLSAGAFVKDIAGEKYVQLASFQQLEYARHLKENLERQGVSVRIESAN